MDEFETTNPVEGDALPSVEAEEQEAPASQDELETPAGDEDKPDEERFEEIERDGRKATIPAWLKPELMMQADYTRKTQELAEARRAFDGERETMHQSDQAEMSAQANLHLIDMQLDRFRKMDWNAWHDSDTAAAQKGFVQFQLLKDARRDTADYIEQLRSQRISNEQQASAKRVENCHAEVAKHVGDWSPATAARLKQAGMQHFGFSAGDIDGIDDARIILALRAAVLWEEHQTRQRQAERHAAAQNVRPAAKLGGSAPKPGLDDQLSPEEWQRRRNGQLRRPG